MPFEEYVVMEGEDIIEAEYACQSWLIWPSDKEYSQLVWTLLLRP